MDGIGDVPEREIDSIGKVMDETYREAALMPE